MINRKIFCKSGPRGYGGHVLLAYGCLEVKGELQLLRAVLCTTVVHKGMHTNISTS